MKILVLGFIVHPEERDLEPDDKDLVVNYFGEQVHVGLAK